MTERKIKGKYYILSFVGTLIIKLLQVSYAYEIRGTLDDIGILSAASYLAGYDWSDAISYTNYFGVAYSVIFAVFFRLFSNPRVIWLLIVMTNVIIVVTGNLIGYYTAVKYWEFEDDFYTCILIVASSMAIRQSTVMSNEPPLYLLTWIMAYLITKYFHKDTFKNKVIWGVGIVLLISYAYLVHTRAVIFLLSFICIMIGMVVFKQEKFWHSIVICLAASVGYILTKKTLRQYIISNIWGVREGLANTETWVNAGNIGQFFEMDYIRPICDALVSNTVTLITGTLGMGIFSYIFFMCLCKKVVIKRDTKIICAEWIFLFSFICVIGIMVGNSLNCGRSISMTYFTDETTYAYKFMAYYRYYATFSAPALFVSSHYLLKKQKFKWISYITVLLIAVYYLVFVVPHWSNSEYINNNTLITMGNAANGFNHAGFKCTMLLILISITLFYSKKYMAIVPFLMSIIILVSHKGINISGMAAILKTVDGGYKLMNYLVEEGEDIPFVYCRSKYRGWEYQFLLLDIPVKIGIPQEEGYLLLSDRANLEIENYSCIKLDNNEYVWVSDEKIRNKIMTYLESIK